MIRWRMTGTCKALKDAPQGAEITRVNDRRVVGHCEACGRYILDGQKYHLWEDSVRTCVKCGIGKKAKKVIQSNTGKSGPRA